MVCLGDVVLKIACNRQGIPTQLTNIHSIRVNYPCGARLSYLGKKNAEAWKQHLSSKRLHLLECGQAFKIVLWFSVYPVIVA